MAFRVVDGPAPHRAPRWPPQTEWLAEYNRRSDYIEAEIVGLIKEIVDLLVLLGYVENDQIDWAPEEGHPINETLCSEYKLEKPVISLMRKLPYIKLSFHGNLSFNIFPASPQVRYLDDGTFRCGRESEMHMYDANVIEAQDIALTVCLLHGTSIILDTRGNVIRLVSPQSPQKKHYPLEKPESKWYYRNSVASHAPSFLKRHVDQLRSLSLIPHDTTDETLDFCDANFHEELNPRMQEVLRNSFGYPDNFRRAEWIAEKDAIWERIMDEVSEEFGEY